MIELSRVRAILDEVDEMVEDLDGIELDETDSLTSQTKSNVRVMKARRSQDLSLMANRLELAAALVRVEYWVARGMGDPVNPDRKDLA